MFKKARWVVDKMFEHKNVLDIRKKGRINQENPEHPMEFRNIHTLFRLKFKNCGTRTLLRYSADDIAKIYINGKFIDMGPAPSYHFAFGYVEIDITEYLIKGVNAAGAHLYYQGELNKVLPSGDFRTGFIAEIEAGSEVIAHTDENTLCKLTKAYGNGDIIGYRTQYLEDFNANLWEYDWALAGFDDSSWKSSAVKPGNDHVFERQITRQLEFYDVLPAKTKDIGKNTMLADLGCEYAGVVYFEASGKKGGIIEIRCAEELDDRGRARYDMRCNCLYRQTFILSGAKREYPEFFDYMAFRYFEIIYPEGVKLENVKIIARNYPFDYKSTKFISNNKLMNSIWKICKNAVRTGTQEGYLDCPTREKGLFLGDMTITAQSHFYLTGDLSIMKRALKSFGLSTYYTHSIQTIAPCHLIHTVTDYAFQYPMNLLTYYENSGDKKFLKDMLPYCEMMMDYFRQYEKNGLLYDITADMHIVDWPRNPYDFSDGYDYNLRIGKTYGTHNVTNVFHICGQQSINKIYEILDMEYEDRLPMLKKAYTETFYDRDRKLFKDTPESSHTALHSNILPLYFGIAPEESIPEIIKMVENKRLNCGVYIAYFLLKALCKNNRTDLAMDLILSDDRFSWSTMIKQGATTCFEVWDKEYKWNTSLCHPWASTPVPILIQNIAGITPKEPGWGKGYDMKSCEIERLGDFELVFHVNGYRIKVDHSKGVVKSRIL